MAGQTTDPTADVALLAPVPYEHLVSGAQVCAEQGKVAFGSRAFDALHKLQKLAHDATADVLIYASERPIKGLPAASWRARFERFVPAKQGAHPEGMKYRPPTTAAYFGDNHGHWLIFWEVSELRELTADQSFVISKLKSPDRKTTFPKNYIPLGPIVIETPF